MPKKSRLSAPQLQAELSRLTDRSRLRTRSSQKGLAASDKVSHKWLYHVDACAGKCPDAERFPFPTCKKNSAADSGCVVGSVGAAAPSWTLSWYMLKSAAQPKPREDTIRAFTLWSAA